MPGCQLLVCFSSLGSDGRETAGKVSMQREKSRSKPWVPFLYISFLLFFFSEWQSQIKFFFTCMLFKVHPGPPPNTSGLGVLIVNNICSMWLDYSLIDQLFMTCHPSGEKNKHGPCWPATQCLLDASILHPIYCPCNAENIISEGFLFFGGFFFLAV